MDIEDFFRRLSYKPDVQLSLLPRGLYSDFYSYRILRHVPDSNNPKEIIPLQALSTLDPIWLERGDKEIILYQVQHSVQKFELHEMDEWLKFDGKHLRDPHPEMKGHK